VKGVEMKPIKLIAIAGLSTILSACETTGPFIGSTYLTNFPGTSIGHEALDVGNQFGQDVIAVNDGKVLHVERAYGPNPAGRWGRGMNGRFLVLEHKDGMRSLYDHLDSIAVEIGQKVNRGQKIGTIGLTGVRGPHARDLPPSYPHLHLEFSIADGLIREDPQKYIIGCFESSKVYRAADYVYPVMCKNVK
jgi:murein DD-endopeptidase MepM/ murein hydrolase activator NlpD